MMTQYLTNQLCPHNDNPKACAREATICHYCLVHVETNSAHESIKRCRFRMDVELPEMTP